MVGLGHDKKHIARFPFIQQAAELAESCSPFYLFHSGLVKDFLGIAIARSMIMLLILLQRVNGKGLLKYPVGGVTYYFFLKLRGKFQYL